MSVPLAYLLTWTTYGTWLPGDERGSVDFRHNAPQSPFVHPDSWRQKVAGTRLHNPPIVFDAAAREVVRSTIVVHTEIRAWEILALNVRTTHVHVVLACGETPPDTAMNQFKSWATRRLREAGLVGADARVWTERGSKQYLWKELDVRKAVAYVDECQGSDLD